MSLDAQKALARRALEMWSSGNGDSPEEIFAEGYVNHQEPDLAGGISSKSLAEWKELLATYHDAFSNARVRIFRQLCEGDLVASHWEFSATLTAEIMTIKS